MEICQEQTEAEKNSTNLALANHVTSVNEGRLIIEKTRTVENRRADYEL
jgi:hypothetical protein